jgi:hypothetical protein
LEDLSVEHKGSEVVALGIVVDADLISAAGKVGNRLKD